MAQTELIGIKLADGSFYPLLKVGTPECKTLELTTANDNQTAISVELYRTKTGGMTDAVLVSKLHLEDLPAQPNGATTVSLSVELDANEVLSAELREPNSDAHFNSIVSLTSLTADESSSNDLILDSPDNSIDLSSLVLPDPAPDDSGDANGDDSFDMNSLVLPDPAPDDAEDVNANADVQDDGSTANDTIGASGDNDLTSGVATDDKLISGDSASDNAADGDFTSDDATTNDATQADADLTNDGATENDASDADEAHDADDTGEANDVDNANSFADNADDDFDFGELELPDDIDVAKPAEPAQNNFDEPVVPLDFENTDVDTTNTLGDDELGAANVIDSSMPQKEELDFSPPKELLDFPSADEDDAAPLKKNAQ